MMLALAGGLTLLVVAGTAALIMLLQGPPDRPDDVADQPVVPNEFVVNRRMGRL